MDAAARVGDRDVVAGRGDLIRGGRGREGGGDDRRTALEFLSGFRGLARIPSQRLLRRVFVSPHPQPRPHESYRCAHLGESLAP